MKCLRKFMKSGRGSFPVGSTRLIAMLLLICAFPVHAAVIERDWHESGDRALTYDAATGLEWLDITVTAGLSYSEVTAELGQDGLFEGFRYASRADVLGLFSAVDLEEIPNVPEYMGGEDKIQELLGYWGVTWDLGGGERTEFLTSHTEGLSEGQHWSGRLFWLETGDTGVAATLYARDDDGKNFSIGSALVRDVAPVPLPPAIWLLGSGVLMLVAGNRWRAGSGSGTGRIL